MPAEKERRSPHNLINLERAAREIRRRGVSHSGDIEEVTGLQRASANKIVNALRDHNVIMAGPEKKIGHRDMLTLRGDAGCVVGIDMTMDKLTVAVGDLTYKLLNKPDHTVRDVPVEDWSKTLDAIAVAVAEQLESARGTHELVGVGLGLPGPVQRGTGAPESDHLLPGWQGVPIADELAKRLDRAGVAGGRVVVGNDASLGALGVLTRAVWGNSTQAPEDLLYVRVTHGIGLGVIVKGHLVTGADGFAGEIGHVRVEADGLICVRCNRRGCLEAVASEKAVIDLLRGHAWHENKHGPTVAADFAKARDKRTREVVGRAGWSIGFVLAAAANVLNPSWIVLGGTMTDMEFFSEKFENTLAKYALPQALKRLRTTTWTSMFNKHEFPHARLPDVGARVTPELLGAMAFVVDELGDEFLKPKLEAMLRRQKATNLGGA